MLHLRPVLVLVIPNMACLAHVSAWSDYHFSAGLFICRKVNACTTVQRFRGLANAWASREYSVDNSSMKRLTLAFALRIHPKAKVHALREPFFNRFDRLRFDDSR